MKDLSRLRRYLRERVNVCEDMTGLLDALDKVYEDAERFENHLRVGPDVNEDELSVFMNDQTRRLVESLLRLSVLSVDVTQLLIERYGVQGVERQLNRFKEEHPSEVLLHDEHPF